MRFKNLERKSEKGNPNMTIFVNGGLGPLQIVLESDTEQCASEKAEPLEGGGTRWCARKDTGVSHVVWRRE